MASSDLSAERAREVFDYDPETGLLTRKPCSATSWLPRQVTKAHNRGYLKTQIDSRSYFVHRLIWLIVHGAWPVHQIDHINRNPADNRIVNLRDVTCAVNQANRRPRRRVSQKPAYVRKGPPHSPKGGGSVTLAKGVRSKPYRASINKKRKRHNLGYFVTPEEGWAAIAAYKQSTGLTN